MDHEIPVEFLQIHVDKSSDFDLLFGTKEDRVEDHDDEPDDVTGPCEKVTIGTKTFDLLLPPDVGTLFAHRVWSGSRLLAEYLASHASDFVQGKRTIEFGAGTALPSLVALSMGSLQSVITDYPHEEVLQRIRETVGHNWKTCLCTRARVAVVGHEWGTSTDLVMDFAKSTTTGFPTTEDHLVFYDVALLSECLWMHRSHAALAQSLDKVLDPLHGVAILTYAHHIPGMEAADDSFFDLCKEIGLVTVAQEANEMEYMWDNTKQITVFLRVLRREKFLPSTS